MTVFFLLVGLRSSGSSSRASCGTAGGRRCPRSPRSGACWCRGDLPPSPRAPMRLKVSGSRCRPTSSSPSRCSRSPERARRVEGAAARAGDRRRPRASSSSPSSTRATSTAWPWRSRSGSSSRSRSCGGSAFGPSSSTWCSRSRRGWRSMPVVCADARRGGHRVPHAGRRLPASATRERRGAPGRRSHAGRAGSAGRRRGAVARPRAHVTRGGLASARAEALLLPWSSWACRSSRWPTPVSGCPVTRSRRPRAAVSGSASSPPGSASPSGSRSPCSSRSASGSAPCPKGFREGTSSRCAIAGIPFTVSLFVAELLPAGAQSSRRRWRSCLRRPRPGSSASSCSDGAPAGRCPSPRSVAGQLTDDLLPRPWPPTGPEPS